MREVRIVLVEEQRKIGTREDNRLGFVALAEPSRNRNESLPSIVGSRAIAGDFQISVVDVLHFIRLRCNSNHTLKSAE